MATTFQRIYVPNLGSGIQIPTLPIGPGPKAMIDPGQGAVNVCHATDDVLQFAAAIAPVNSALAENGHLLKNSAAAVMLINADIGATSGWLLLLDMTAIPTIAGALAAPQLDRVWISSNGTSGHGSLGPYPGGGLKTVNGAVALFSVDPSPLNFGTPPAGSKAWFMGLVQ